MPPPRHDAWARRATLGARVAVGAATAAVFVLALAPSAAARHRVEPVRSIPVRFRVANTNRSGIPATSDGKTYTVRGHLTGPRRVLAHPHAVTLYFFGYDAGEWNWRLTDVKGYNHPREMARRGHVSVTIDELGYDSSDHPEGMGTCMGAQADMAHQIVGMLRSGRYGARGRRAPRFSEIVLAGHDVGGLVAEIEASVYRDVDALVEVTWAEQGFTPFIVERATVSSFDWCTTDPQRAENGQPGSPSGYHYYTSSPQEFAQKLFFAPDPRVLAAALRRRNRNPCGMIRSAPDGVFVDKVRASEITVPVLIVFGAQDTLVWSRDGERQQQDNFPRSRDKTTVFIPRAGHFPMLERTAPKFRRVLGGWLARHGA